MMKDFQYPDDIYTEAETDPTLPDSVCRRS